MSRILGIDPGVSGALALYDSATGDLVIHDMPTLEIARAKGKRRTVAPYELARLVDDWAAGIDAVFLEQSWPRPTDGAIAGFGFGTNYGLVYGVCAANFLRVELVAPQTWKRALGVKGDKDESRARASALFPRHCAFWTRKMDDGRAEAALIARYGAQILTPPSPAQALQVAA